MHIVPLLLQTLGQDQKDKNTPYFFHFLTIPLFKKSGLNGDEGAAIFYV